MTYTFKNQIDGTTITVDINDNPSEDQLRRYVSEWHEPELYDFNNCADPISYVAFLIAFDLIRELIVNGRYEARKIIDNYIREINLTVTIPEYYRQEFRPGDLELVEER